MQLQSVRSCIASDFVVLVLSPPRRTVLVIVIVIEVTVKGHLFTYDQLDFIELKSKVVRMVALLSTT